MPTTMPTRSATSTLGSNVAVNTNGNLLDVTAADISLTGSSSITAGTFNLQTPHTVTPETIGIGTAVGSMTITGTELGDITATTLNIGVCQYRVDYLRREWFRARVPTLAWSH